MNLKQIETFVTTARTGSMSAAAVRLNMTQPAVSMRIRDLEKQLDIVLIDRAGRELRLTPHGREFLDHAEEILAKVDQAQNLFGSQHVIAGRVRLGVTETVAITWLPALVSRINKRFPKVVVELDVDLTAGVWRKLNAGDVDFALLPGPVQGPRLVTRFLGSIRYEWMASSQLPIPNRTLVPEDISKWPIIMLGQESNLHDVVEAWFRSHGLRSKLINVCNSLGVVAALTRAGLGISLLPPSALTDAHSRRELKLLRTEPRLADLEFHAVYHQNMDSTLIRYIAESSLRVSTFKRASKRRRITE